MKKSEPLLGKVGGILLGVAAVTNSPAAAQNEKPSTFVIKLDAGYARLSAPRWRSGILLDRSDVLNSPKMFSASPNANGFRVGVTLGTDIGNIFGKQRRTGWRIEGYGSFARAAGDSGATVKESIVMLITPFGLTNGRLYDGRLDLRLRSTLTDFESGMRLRLPTLGGKRLKLKPYVVLAYSRYEQSYGFRVNQNYSQVSEQSESLVTNSLLFGAGANLKLMVVPKFHLLFGGAVLLDAAFTKLNADQTLLPGGGGFPPVINATYSETASRVGYRARFSAGAAYSTGRITIGVKVDGDFRSYAPQSVHTTFYPDLLSGVRPLRLGDDTILNYSVSAVFKVRF